MIYQGDCLTVLPTLDADSIQCCVTSPPYYGLRDYGCAGQIGLEGTPNEYVEKLVAVFREVKRVLRNDGTVFLNLGDSYAGSGRGNNPNGKQGTNKGTGFDCENAGYVPSGLKPKDLIGIPWRVAFALQADGWYLRQDIIWAKPNPMPESVTDRCTKSHEYIFLLTKSARYFYDAFAVMEPVKESSIARLSQPNILNQIGSDRVPGKTNGNMKAVAPASWKGSEFHTGKTGGHQLGRAQKDRKHDGTNHGSDGVGFQTHVGNSLNRPDGLRNRRSVWTITTQPYKEAHFATFPEEIPRTCILAGSKKGDTILDPFSGAGTTGVVAEKFDRKYIGIELNPQYTKLAEDRIYNVQPLFAGVNT